MALRRREMAGGGRTRPSWRACAAGSRDAVEILVRMFDTEATVGANLARGWNRGLEPAADNVEIAGVEVAADGIYPHRAGTAA